MPPPIMGEGIITHLKAILFTEKLYIVSQSLLIQHLKSQFAFK